MYHIEVFLNVTFEKFLSGSHVDTDRVARIVNAIATFGCTVVLSSAPRALVGFSSVAFFHLNNQRSTSLSRTVIPSGKNEE